MPLAISTATPQLLQTMHWSCAVVGCILGMAAEGSSFAVTPKKERRSRAVFPPSRIDTSAWNFMFAPTRKSERYTLSAPRFLNQSAHDATTINL